MLGAVRDRVCLRGGSVREGGVCVGGWGGWGVNIGPGGVVFARGGRTRAKDGLQNRGGEDVHQGRKRRRALQHWVHVWAHSGRRFAFAPRWRVVSRMAVCERGAHKQESGSSLASALLCVWGPWCVFAGVVGPRIRPCALHRHDWPNQESTRETDQLTPTLSWVYTRTASANWPMTPGPRCADWTRRCLRRATPNTFCSRPGGSGS